MFGSLGLPELIMIFVLALLLFGPRKLPEIGKSLGKAMGEFRRASNDLKRSLEEEVAADELRQVGSEVRDAGRAAATAVSPAADEVAPPAAPADPRDERPGPLEPR
jgi:TatA/E family protein of Tat protein translocase